MRPPTEILSTIKSGDRLKTVEDHGVLVLFRASTYKKDGNYYPLAIYGRVGNSDTLRSWDEEGKLIKETDQDFDGLDIDPSSLQISDIK